MLQGGRLAAQSRGSAPHGVFGFAMQGGFLVELSWEVGHAGIYVFPRSPKNVILYEGKSQVTDLIPVPCCLLRLVFAFANCRWHYRGKQKENVTIEQSHLHKSFIKLFCTAQTTRAQQLSRATAQLVQSLKRCSSGRFPRATLTGHNDVIMTSFMTSQ